MTSNNAFGDWAHVFAGDPVMAAVGMAVIALWLGQGSIETPHIYVEADLGTKQRELERLGPATGPVRRFTAEDALTAFLGPL